MGNSIDGKTNKVSESAGLESGLSKLAGFDSDKAGADADYNQGSMLKKQLSSKSVSKFGKSFEIEGCK